MSTIYVHQSHCKLQLHENQFVICSDEKERLACLPEMQIERIVVLGNAQLTTPLIKRCLRNGIEIIYTSENGHYLGRTECPGSRTLARQVQQIELFSKQKTCLSWAKAIITAKFHATLLELRRFANNNWADSGAAYSKIHKMMKLVAGATSLPKLMGLEAIVAKEYYALFPQLLPQKLSWPGRKRRPAPEPVNALLSLSSSFLTQQLVSGCFRHGLESGVGFLHVFGYNRPSLALDLLEPLRCLVSDHFVLKSLRHQLFKVEDFIVIDGACRLGEAGFKVFVAAFDSDQKSSGKRRESPAALLEMILTATRAGIDSGQVPDYKSILPAR